jgi:signal transduction histidine kinase
MDFALQAALLGAVMGSAVLAVSTIYGWTLPAAPKAYGWWATAFVLDTASGAVLIAGPTPQLVAPSDLLHGIAAALTLGAAGVFAGQRITPLWMATGLLAAAAWVPAAEALRHSLHLLDLPLAALGGIPMLVSGWCFLAHGDRTQAGGHKLAAAAFIGTGMHHLASPLLHIHAGSASWGLLLQQFLAMVLAVALLLVVMRREQARADLLQNQLVEALGGVQDGVALFDTSDCMVTCNDRYRELMAQAGAGAEGELLDGIRRHPALVFEHTCSPGVVLEVRSTPMPGGGLILTFTDISERKKVEQTLRGAKEAAERGNRAKATFLANISHELRTPLNAIIGFSELMRHEIFGPLEPSNYRNYVEDIHESGMHLLELINDILDMSKAEAGMTDLVESAVDVSAIVRSSVRMMSRRAETANIAVTEDLPADLPFLRADERRVRQIVLNLISNAVKFTEDGGSVAVAARADVGGFVLTVADTGIGMSPEELVRVMEPFVQADTRLSRKYEGTGLGLPLTKVLVAAHGGTLTLVSQPELGTTATVFFPRARILRTPGAVLAIER